MQKKFLIPVILSSDECYAPFVATTIASICDNTTSFVHFYVLDCGITDQTKGRILKLERSFSNFHISWIEVNANAIFSTFRISTRFSKATYARLICPELFPNLNKVIYSDVDVIFLDDIKKLYDEDLQGNALGAVWEDYMERNGNNRNHLLRLGISMGHKYFCAGILLLDLNRWRQQEITSKLFQLENKLRSKLLLQDQDLLNVMFANNYRSLNEKYGITAPRARAHFRNGRLIDCVVRHFEGPKKPWLVHPLIFERRKSNYIGKSKFWYYAKMTDFYLDLIKRFPLYYSVQKLLIAAKQHLPVKQ